MFPSATRHGAEFWFNDDGVLQCDDREARVYRGNGSRGYPVTPSGGTLCNVHDIICEIFRGPKPTPTSVCHHIDGNRFNWEPYNLEWTTQSENCRAAIARARQAGLDRYAADNNVAPLDWDTMLPAARREVMRLGRAAVRAENRRHLIEFCLRIGSRLPRNF